MANIETYSDYCKNLEKNYTEEQQIVIENFISYYINEYNGYGKKNCQITYKEDLEFDKTGELHDFALIGVEFSKKAFQKRNQKRKQKKI